MPQNVSKQHPCPICGKHDYCFSNDKGADGIIRVCGRVRQDMVNGTDGRVYKMLPSKSSEYTSYVDYEDDLIRKEQRRKEWCEQHGKRYVPKEGIDLSGTSMAPAEAPWLLDESVVQPLSHAQIDSVLRPWLKYVLVLAPCHKDKLMLEWSANKAMADKIFARWMIRTLPPEDKVRAEAQTYYRENTGGPLRSQLIAKLLEICKEKGLDSPKGIPGFYQDDVTGEWKINSRAGIVYPVYDTEGRIYRLRIGVDTPNVKGIFNGQTGEYQFYRDSWYFERDGKPKEEKNLLVWRYGSRRNLIALNAKGLPSGKPDGKYVNFSSFKEWKNYEKHTIVNKYLNGCRSGSQISVYRPQNARPGIVWITEGEKKAMVIATVMGVTVLCVPGVGSYEKLFESVEGGPSIMEVLTTEGVKMVVVAYDADKDANEKVAHAEEGLLKSLISHGFMAARTNWNKAFGKGIDDSIIEGIMPQISPVFFA